MKNILSQAFAFIDLETTGGSPPGDRIIEIGLKIVLAGQVVDEWQTLVNPKKTISPFIEHYTGISNEMVQDAPLFSEVAETLKDKLTDTIFVAHNARFDYGFVKSEFRRLNVPFSAKVLCTVKLSRQLYPHYIKHSMDALISRHQLSAGPRHRAMGDVDSMLAFFHHALNEHGDDVVGAVIEKVLKRPSLPPHLPTDVLEDIPQSHGVYRFYGENDVLLYVGKANNLYQRVMSHFSSDHTSAKEMAISQSIRRLEWTETAGEFGALLLELKQIKALKPIHNKRSRSVGSLVTLKLVPNEQGYLAVKRETSIDSADMTAHYGLFSSHNVAEKALRGISETNELCLKLLGLEATQGACSWFQLGRCKGACVGEEDTTRYNLRTHIALHSLQLKKWPYSGAIGVVEKNQFTGRMEIHVMNNWVHLGTIDSNDAWNDFEISQRDSECFDKDGYKLMSKYLMSSKYNLTILKKAIT